jgi:hypothetical protein
MNRIVKLNTRLDLVGWLPFIEESVKEIKDKNPGDTGLGFEQVKAVLRKEVDNPDFAIWIQLVGFEPKAMLVAYASLDIYGGKQVLVWMMRALPGATSSSLQTELIAWARKIGAEAMFAQNLNFAPVKDRWFEKHGWELNCNVYKRKVI